MPKKTYLITGGAGFIGSNFIRFLLSTRQNIRVINVDKLTYAGNLENLKDIEENDNYFFYPYDICDQERIDTLFKACDIDYVVNFAAESHVDRSIRNPEIFVQTNINGTRVLLDEALTHWKTGGGFRDGCKYIQISTDEVYGSLGESGYFTEKTPVNPHSPYSASKAAADLLVLAYHDTFGLPVNITRCSNNYGPYQFPEKLIPLMISNCLSGKPLPVYGDGRNVRDWLHVLDHCEAIGLVVEKGADGEVYNIGGHNERSNIAIVKTIIKTVREALDRSDPRLAEINDRLICFVADRMGHDRRYAIDPEKIGKELGWKPKIMFDEGISMTVRWYLTHSDWLAKVTSGEYRSYYEAYYGGLKHA
jgi:dTDP-glucose 4,6-dehydratase